MLLAEKGVRGKGWQPLSPPQHTVAPEREQRSGLKSNFRLPDRPIRMEHIPVTISGFTYADQRRPVVSGFRRSTPLVWTAYARSRASPANRVTRIG
jgi:hypothetical protein